MTTYTIADDEQHEALREVMEDHHEDLVRAGLTVSLLVAYPECDDEGEPKAPALVHQGYPAEMIARVISHRDRARGVEDVSIEIDGEWWAVATESEQFARLDHELTHFELALDESGVVKLDAGGRPKVRLRKHDRQFGWFDEVAERWGQASAEVQQARSFLAGDVRKVYQLDLFTGGGSSVDLDRIAKKAAESLRPKPGSGIDAVEITSGGRGVRLTPTETTVIGPSAGGV